MLRLCSISRGVDDEMASETGSGPREPFSNASAGGTGLSDQRHRESQFCLSLVFCNVNVDLISTRKVVEASGFKVNKTRT